MRFVSILAWAAVLAPTSVLAQTWQTYTYNDQGFSVQLPTPPTVETGSVISPVGAVTPVRTYAAKGAGINYALSIFDLSKTGLTQPDAMAKAEQAITAKGAVAVAVDARINRQFGRELTVNAPDGARLTVALFVMNQRLYQLVAKASPPDAVDRSADALHFQQSLEFTGQPGPDEPGGQGGGFGGRGGGRLRGGPGGGRGGPFNAQAAAACAGKTAGAVVKLQTPDGAVDATCVLIARPNRPPPGDGPPPGEGPPPEQ